MLCLCAADTVKKADIVNALVNAADIRVNGKTKLVILIKYASKKEGIINQNYHKGNGWIKNKRKK